MKRSVLLLAAMLCALASAGVISDVTEDPLTVERQLQAGFTAEGTAYVSRETPEAVYVRMSTDWFQNRYIRFVSNTLQEGGTVFWRGCLYFFGMGQGTVDTLPKADLETNCIADGWGYPLHGRMVYGNAGDGTVLYVCEQRHWAGGTEHAWRVCRIRNA